MSCAGGVEFRHQMAMAIRESTHAQAMSQAILSFVFPDFPRGEAPTAGEPPSPIHFSSLARSLALCHRSSGSLARHFLIACSSAGGVIGFVALSGSGSFSRIAEATLN